MRDDLERFLAGEAISVVPETTWSRFVRSVRRRPSLSAATLVGITMAILAGIVGSLMLNQKNRELSTTNEQLETAVDEALIAKKRATSSSDILKRAMLASTPEEAQGDEPTVRQLLDDLSMQLLSDDFIDPLVAADTHYTLAQAYDSLGIYEKAQEHADLCYAIFERELGADSPEALAAKSGQAKVLSARDLDLEAIELSGDALARARRIESLDADTLITLIDNHASALSDAPNNDHEKILALHREAHELSSKELGATHQKTLNMASNLAGQMMDSGDLVGAEVLFLEIHSAHEERWGKKHPETLIDVQNLIALRFNQGDFQAANDLCQEHLQMFEDVFGLNHKHSIRLRLSRCQTWGRLGQWDACYKDAEVIWQRSKEYLGPLHERTFEARGIMAGALIEAGKLDEAARFSEEHFEIAKEAFGPNHPYTVQAVTLLFDLAEKRNDPDTMAKWLVHLRGSQWEGPAEEQVKAAREKKKQQESVK